MTSKDQDLTQQASEPIQLYQFGPHFRYWREKRGYSLKEAAGDIISVSHLSQFEKGTKTLTLPKFSDLLMNIGMDITDFFQTYPGQHIDKYLKLAHSDDFASILDYYRNFPHLQELLKYLLKERDNNKLLTPQNAQPPGRDLIEKILNQEAMNNIELETLWSLLDKGKLPQDLIALAYQRLSTSILSNLKFSTEFLFPALALNQLKLAIYLCKHLSRQGYYKETLKLINDIKQLLSKASPDILSALHIDFLVMQCYQVYTLIRMGKKTEAFELRVKLTKTLDALIEGAILEKQARYLITIRTQFNDSCRDLLDGRIK